MTTTHHEHPQASPRAPAVSGPLKVALWMVAAVGGFYLLREHWNHLAGNWVYLLLLACPLMHLFHGHGHRGHGGPSTPSGKPSHKPSDNEQ